MNDPKFSWVARKASTNVASVIAVWAALLEHASQDDDRGGLSGFDPESQDCALGLDDGTCQRVMDAMRAKGVLDDQSVAQWEFRQNGGDTNAERQRRFRENHKTPSEESKNKKDQIRLEENSLDNVTVTLRKVPKKATEFPEDLALDDQQTKFATDRLTNVDAAELFVLFKAHHVSKGTLSKDWWASWRTYVGNARKWGYPMLAPVPKALQKIVRYDARGRVIDG